MTENRLKNQITVNSGIFIESGKVRNGGGDSDLFVNADGECFSGLTKIADIRHLSFYEKIRIKIKNRRIANE